MCDYNFWDDRTWDYYYCPIVCGNCYNRNENDETLCCDCPDYKEFMKFYYGDDNDETET